MILSLGLAAPAFSQTVDTFNPGAGAYPYAMAVQTDGKIVAGGSFSSLGGATRSRLSRLNPDGTLDTTFKASAGGSSSGFGMGTVYCLAVQPDGKILVGGDFTSLSGVARGGFGRLNADGTLDTAFNPAGTNIVYCLALQPDGKIVFGGQGTMPGATVPFPYLGRLNADGSPDTSFDVYVGAGSAASVVSAVALQPDGKILVGGQFTSLRFTARTNLGRLYATGAVDPTFSPRVAGISPFATSSTVECLLVQPDGSILVGGFFSSLCGSPCTNLGRLSANGTLDTSFYSSANADVYSLAMQADGRIFVGGAFSSLGGLSCTNLGRLNSDGSLDTSFDARIAGSGLPWPPRTSSSTVYSLAMQPDGNIVVAGNFTKVKGQTRNNLARLINTDATSENLEFDGSTISWWRAGSSPEIWRTTFEACTNGADWLSLGSGTYIWGGWQLSSLNLPFDATIRARGYLAGGYGNGSASYVETTAGGPMVTCQPAARTNTVGTTVRFNVQAAGTAPLSYQWRKDGVDLVDGGRLSGAQMPMLTLSNVFGTDAGGYLVVVSNPIGSITSRVASLTVVAPPTLGGGNGTMGFQAGRFGFNLAGAAGQTVIIEGSTDLANWTALSTNTFGFDPLSFSDPGSPGFSTRFYRARVQ